MSSVFSGVKNLILLALSVFLMSCGGGGGGDGSISSPGGISINTAAINFQAIRNGPLPAPQNFSIEWTNPDIAGILVGLPRGGTLPGWLGLSLTGNSSPLGLTVVVGSTNEISSFLVLRIVSVDIDSNPLDVVDVRLDYTVTEIIRASPTDLSFSHAVGNTAPPPNQPVGITGFGLDWQASSNQPWVTLNNTSGVAPSDLRVGVDPTNLPVGLNSAVISVVNVNDPSNKVDINVDLQIVSTAIQVDSTSLSFSGINGSALSTQSLPFSLNNLQSTAWTVSTSDPWITLDSTIWSGPDTVVVGIDAAGASLASGNYSGTVTFSTTVPSGTLNLDVPVNLTLTRATLQSFPASLTFTGDSTADIDSQPIYISINTFPSSHPWQVILSTDTGSGWLGASVISGDGSQIQTPSDISINTTSTAGLAGGAYTGSVEISATVNGDIVTQSIPVTLNLESHRLHVEDNGVALLSTASISRLSHSVTVSDNRGTTTTPWNATSDKSWLTVTSSGLTGDSLTLNADPTGLALDTIQYATITLSSTEPGVVNSGTETIQVGFYVTGNTPANQVSAAVQSLAGSSFSGLIADPIRPYVYLTHRGSDIEVFNIYTGALVSTISNAGSVLGNMAISSDGQMLYVLDYVNNNIVTVNLTATPLTANPAWTDSAWSNCNCSAINYYSELIYTRVKGRPVLIGGAKDVIDANTGARLYPSDNISFLQERAVASLAAKGLVMFSAPMNRSPHTVVRHSIKYTESSETFVINQTQSASKSGFTRGVTSDPEGDTVYRACWYPLSEVEAYSGTDLSTINSVTSGTNGGALFAEDGLLYCARYYSDFSGSGGGDVWSVNPATNSVVSEFNVSGNVGTRLFDISGDGMRLITRSNNQSSLTMTLIP